MKRLLSWLCGATLFITASQGQSRNPFQPFDIARCTLKHEAHAGWQLKGTLISLNDTVAQFMTREQQFVSIALNQYLPDSHLQVVNIAANQVQITAKAPCPRASWTLTLEGRDA